MRTNHIWTDEERAIIRRDYRHNRQSLVDLAKRLGVTPFGVGGQVNRMGIAKSDDRRYWTKEEEETLAELMPHFCSQRVAQMMHRSINSVVVKSKRLNISTSVRNGWYTKREVMEILGHGHRWIQRRIDSGAIKATYHHNGNKPSQKGPWSWHIDEKSLVDFIRRYPEELVGCNIDIIQIVELLAGIKNGA